MQAIADWVYSTSDFLHAGGPVLKVLAWVIALFWLLAFERLLYLTFSFRHSAVQALFQWRSRPDRESWDSRQIRDAVLSRLDLAAAGPLPVIKTLVALCPLLGLLGTVTGMITIFEVMAITGSGNPRSMAEGVSRATIPTMAGMVAALAGVLGVAIVSRRYEHLRNRVRDAFSSSDVGYRGPHWREPVRLALGWRLFIAMFLAAAATVGLLLLMQTLIETGKSAITEGEKVYFIDFIRIPQETAVARKERKVRKPEAVERPPEFTQPRQTLDESSAENVVAVSMPSVDTGIGDDMQISGMARLPESDGDYLPLVKVQPIYPRSALIKRIEGYVLLSFTVTTTGAVRDPVVVESSHPVFERAAIQAALKFKYKPRVVDGEPIEVHGVLNKISFEIIDM